MGGDHNEIIFSLYIIWIILIPGETAHRSITLRAINSEDDEFLFSVYASSHTNELELVNWSKTQKETFLRMQFTAQHQYYIENYPSAKFQVIVLDSQSIGRLYVDRRADEIRIMDITLLPGFQRRGMAHPCYMRF